jgi:hypothetical protein
MKKYMINPVTGEEQLMEEASTADDVRLLKRNVKDLQSQLAAAYTRIGELNDVQNIINRLIQDYPNDQELGQQMRLMNNES